MILSQAQARELGEALLDAVEAIDSTEKPQAIVVLNDDIAVAVPLCPDIQEHYETPVIVQV